MDYLPSFNLLYNETMRKIIEELRGKYDAYLKEEAARKDTAEKIHVDEIASKVASFYENTRNVIDYREDHLIRRNLIERTLQRRIFLQDFNKHFAEPLIKELIRSGHLPNDFVPESKIADVEKIIGNLMYFLKHGSFSNGAAKEKMADWLIAVTSSAIEEELFRPVKEHLLADIMFNAMRDNVLVKNADIGEQKKNVQLFIGVQKALFRPDEVELTYRLLRFAYMNWGKLDEAELSGVANDLEALKLSLDLFLKDPLGKYFIKACNKEKLVFLLVGDVAFSSDWQPSGSESALQNELQLCYNRRYKRAAVDLRKLAFLSVISFFVSKVLVAFVIEVPLDKKFHAFSLLHTIINIALPPLLMFIIVALIKLPSKENFYLVAGEVISVLMHPEEKKYTVVVPKKKNFVSEAFMNLAYIAALGLSLYILTKILFFAQFSLLNVVIFILFTSMVIATGVKVNNRAKEMSMEKDKPTMMGFLLDLLAVPFMAIGRWTIAGLSKFNVLIIAFNVLVELPFQFFIEFLENLRAFINRKKEETV